MSEREAHPVADLFPMLADDELQELAADIKQRGLIQPIVLDPQGRVLDGRNRLAACELAGIEPAFEIYEGDDPDGYALAVNIARRHLRPSQRYMLIEKARRLTELTKVSLARGPGEERGLNEASVVLDYAPDLADVVVSGNLSLANAAETARQRKREAAEIKAKKDRLRKGAPDLAEQTDDGRLDLDEALGALEVREQRARQEAAEQRTAEQERQRKREEEQRDARALLVRIVDLVAPASMTDGFVESWAEHLGDLDAEQIKRAERAGQVLLELVERKRR